MQGSQDAAAFGDEQHEEHRASWGFPRDRPCGAQQGAARCGILLGGGTATLVLGVPAELGADEDVLVAQPAVPSRENPDHVLRHQRLPPDVYVQTQRDAVELQRPP